MLTKKCAWVLAGVLLLTGCAGHIGDSGSALPTETALASATASASPAPVASLVVSAMGIVAKAADGSVVREQPFSAGWEEMRDLLSTVLASSPTEESWLGEAGESCDTTMYTWDSVQLARLTGSGSTDEWGTYPGMTDRDWYVVFSTPSTANGVVLTSSVGVDPGMSVSQAKVALATDSDVGYNLPELVEDSGRRGVIQPDGHGGGITEPIGLVISGVDSMFLVSPVTEQRAFYGC